MLCLAPATADDNLGPNMLPCGSMDSALPTYVPWAGVDGNNNIHGIEGKQIGVNDDGGIRPSLYGPSVATASLRGNGLLDLVLADSYGFFWYFPNSGTPTNPIFTQGEIMPVWLAEECTQGAEGYENIVPRIQLLDFDGSGKYDILAGVYSGKLFHVRNEGSDRAPMFRPTYDRDPMLINTHRRGLLWNNFMAPFMTTAFSSSIANSLYSLVTGEGTYSANSIYLFKNTGSNSNPSYDEDHMQKIIPGMGLEHLTPVVLDWNNDGKPDVLTGDRTGYLTLFLNTSTDPDHPTFDAGTHIKIGGTDNFGQATTVAISDLTNNHLPNLIIGRNDGTILYAINTGKIGAPDFSTPLMQLKGVLPTNYHYVAPTQWFKTGAYGVPDELIALVNPQIEPGFTFPEGETTRFALKFYVWPVKNTFFPERYYPQNEDEWHEHQIDSFPAMNLKMNTRYRLHCWLKSDGNLSSLRYRIAPVPGTGGPQQLENPLNVGTDWTEATDTFQLDDEAHPEVKTWPCKFEFRFTGQTTFYIDDLKVQEVLQQ